MVWLGAWGLMVRQEAEYPMVAELHYSYGCFVCRFFFTVLKASEPNLQELDSG